jgi:molecular chaperone GrpE
VSLLEAQKKAQEYLEALQRERAEFVNYKKRIERDQQLFRQEAIGNVVKRYLPIVMTWNLH